MDQENELFQSSFMFFHGVTLLYLVSAGSSPAPAVLVLMDPFRHFPGKLVPLNMLENPPGSVQSCSLLSEYCVQKPATLS